MDRVYGRTERVWEMVMNWCGLDVDVKVVSSHESLKQHELYAELQW